MNGWTTKYAQVKTVMTITDFTYRVSLGRRSTSCRKNINKDSLTEYIVVQVRTIKVAFNFSVFRNFGRSLRGRLYSFG